MKAADPAVNGLSIDIVTVNTAWVRSSLRGRQLFSLLERLGIPRQWNASERLWMIPRARVADLVADCERSRRPVHVTGAWS